MGLKKNRWIQTEVVCQLALINYQFAGLSKDKNLKYKMKKSDESTSRKANLS